MITDVGKTPASTILPDSSIVTFFNGTIKQTSVKYVGLNGSERYNVQGTGIDITNKHRALYFIRSFPGSGFGATVPLPVVYIPSSINQNTQGNSSVSCSFLYECIAPQICCNDSGVYQIIFWTNTDDASKLSTNASGETLYSQDAVTKFKTDSLGDTESVSTSVKLLCSANIDFELLSSSLGGGRQLTPVIKKIIVLAAISNENYATDFAGGGSGGGLKVHTHINNDNGGFAFACFAPSATINPISWT